MERYLKFPAGQIDARFGALKDLPGAICLNDAVFVPEASFDTFHIASVSRSDFEQINRDGSSLTDEQMMQVAESIGDELYAGHPERFDESLRFWADHFRLPPLPQEESDVRTLYERYKAENGGKEPLFASVNVVFKDDGREVSGYTMKLNTKCPCEGDAVDEAIFYYCNGLDELYRLLNRDNGEDFWISKVFGFDSELLPF